MKIIELYRESDKEAFLDQPLRYRFSISIEPHNHRIVLLREYFRAGFHAGEEDDEFYFDNEHRDSDTHYRCSFMTQKINNKKYHKKKEIELINKFYDKCGESIKTLEKRLIDETKRVNENINMYNGILKKFEYIKREDKLKKLKKKLK